MQMASMLPTVLLLSLSVLDAAASVQRTQDTHPIVVVIEKLEAMQTQSTEDRKNEEVAYATYEHGTRNIMKDLKTAIIGEQRRVDELTAEIKAHEEEITGLNEKIDETTQLLQDLEAEKADAQSKRDDENSKYTTTKDELESTQGDIDSIIDSMSNTEGCKDVVLLQVVAKAHRVLRRGAPGESKFECSSLQAIELLKGLNGEVTQQLTDVNQAETNKLNAHKLRKADLNSQIDRANDKKDLLTERRDETDASKSSAQNDLNEESTNLKNDRKSLRDTSAEFNEKQSEMAHRTKERQDEASALAKAIDILKKVSGVQSAKPEPESFLQIVDPKTKAIELLRSKARKVGSVAFRKFTDELASRVKGPFTQIDNMIQKMIFRLMSEQKDEDDHKNWCDQELQKTDDNVALQQEKVDDHKAKVAQLSSTIEQLETEMAAANDEVVSIETEMKEITEARQFASQEYKKAQEDAEKALDALEKAEATIVEYYKRDEAFLQQPAEPFATDSTHVEDVDAPGGIMSILEDCTEHFAQMKADIVASEQSEKEEFGQEMKDLKVRKVEQSTTADRKNAQIKSLTAENNKAKKSLRGHEKELYDNQVYSKDLEKPCRSGMEKYDDRKAARSGEIDALNQAKDILKDAAKEQSGLDTRL